MNLSSSSLKDNAKKSLAGNYWLALAACLIPMLVSIVLGSLGGGVTLVSALPSLKEIAAGNIDAVASANIKASPLSSLTGLAVILLRAPLVVGVSKFFLDLADRRGADLKTVFGEFSHYGNTLLLSVLMGLFTALWSMLLIVPGIIAALGYAMAPYIIAEHPEIKATDAIKMSKKMMEGKKGKLFLLELSFIGWYILCLFTAGIGAIFLTPYVTAAKAEFYNEVSGKNYQKSLEASAAGSFNANAYTQNTDC